MTKFLDDLSFRRYRSDRTPTGRKPGRPVVPLEKRKVGTSVYLPPDVLKAAYELGNGKISRGIIQAFRMIMTLREANEAAIKAAAESRDQEAVKRSGEPLREPKSAFDD